jgi:hypothetical protein
MDISIFQWICGVLCLFVVSPKAVPARGRFLWDGLNRKSLKGGRVDLPSPKFSKLSPTGLPLFILSFHAWLFIVPAFLELFEETLIGQFPLRDLERLLYIIMINPNFQRSTFTK